MKPKVIIHGGCGALKEVEKYRISIRQILESLSDSLHDSTAVDIVTKAVELLENDPNFNAGRGAVLNHEGMIDLDASIMDGKQLRAGAIAGVQGVKNPVKLARAVMEQSEHVFLIGAGAEIFARQHSLEMESTDYFVTPERVAQLEEARRKDKVVLDHSDTVPEKKLGTVGAVAIDKDGNIAAATSTGGIVNKKYGRVGDSPVLGSGTYADNSAAGVSATGYGEHFLRTVLAKHAADLVTYRDLSAQAAAEAAIEHLVSKVNGLGGIIVIDSKGNIGNAHSTPMMLHGYVEANHEPKILF